jgi:hypothetical protein
MFSGEPSAGDDEADGDPGEADEHVNESVGSESHGVLGGVLYQQARDLALLLLEEEKFGISGERLPLCRRVEAICHEPRTSRPQFVAVVAVTNRPRHDVDFSCPQVALRL